MLPLLAEVADLEARLGSQVDDETKAEALLDYASALVRKHVGELWVDEEGDLTDLPDGVRQVVVEMVARAVDNPRGVTQAQETVGPFSQGVSFGQDAHQRIYLTKADKTILGRGTAGDAFSVDTAPDGCRLLFGEPLPEGMVGIHFPEIYAPW